MKTSLVIDDRIFRTARAEAARQGKTISELLSYWARVGWETLRRQKRPTRTVAAVDLGGPAHVDLTNRRDWLDTLDR